MSSFSSGTSVDGLISGLNTTQIIGQLMALERQPQVNLKNQVARVNTVVSAYQSINSKLAAIQTAADALTTPSGWQNWVASSSSANVTATAGAGAIGGSLTFTVNALASASSFISNGSVSSASAVITSGNLLVAKGGQALGFSTLAGDTALGLGSHTIAVTQSSAGATRSGASALGPTTTITAGGNDTVTYNLDGTAKTLTLAAGTYSPSQLASAVASASGGALGASLGPTGNLVVTTSSEGSAHSLQITGGTALTALGLSTDSAAVAGTDGVVTVDGHATTLADISAGASVTLASASGGNVTATFSGGVRNGTLSAANVSTGDGSLTSVVAAVNGANVGVTASALQTGTASFRLQLASNTTGAASAVNVASSSFAAIGGLATLSAGSDANITVGSGPNAFTVSSATNTVSSLMPGVTLTLNKADQTTPVTVSLSADGSGAAKKVQALVDAANAAIGEINTDTAYNADQKSAGPLIGDVTVNSLQSSILSAVTAAVGSSSLGSTANAGITLNNDGTLSFDSAAFTKAYNTDPTAVASLFRAGATSSSPRVSFFSAGDSTASGSYGVVVTAAATQATDTGATVAGGALSADETVGLSVGSASVSYAAKAGQSLADVAAGITAAAANSSLGVTASVRAGAIVLTSMGYGSASTFSVTSSRSGSGSLGLVGTPGSPQSFTGMDVAGTINGVAATGQGQILTAPGTTQGAAGLILNVSATAADLAAAGGSLSSTVSYSPGVAANLAHVAALATDPTSGTITNAVSGEQSLVADLTQQIANWNPILDERQADLQKQYSNLEVMLGQLRAVGSQLTGQIAGLLVH